VTRNKPDKQSLLPALAAYVLEHGLNTASLRPMAAAANTSDRMLIYHFGNKENLIAALLEHLAQRMAEALDAAMPPTRVASEKELVRDIVTLMRAPLYRPYIRVWLDIISAASQGSKIHQSAGRAIIDIYLDWLAKRHPDGAQGAAFALTLIEGTLIMDAVGHDATADAAVKALQG